MTDAETKAFAMIGHALSYGLLARLTNKGLLTGGEVQDILDGVLTTFEEGPDDEAHRVARVMLDGMAQIASLHSGSKGE